MTTKWGDTREGRELADFNLEFLALVGRSPPGRPAYGLDPAIARRLAGLTGDELRVVASMPCLLAGFPGLLLPPAGVAEALPAGRLQELTEGPVAYAMALLTWLWQMARQQSLAAVLSVGPDGALLEHLGRLGFGAIRRVGPMAAACLEARFCRHGRVWPDLIRAARSADPEVIQATRNSLLLLSLVGPRPPGAARSRQGPVAPDH